MSHDWVYEESYFYINTCAKHENPTYIEYLGILYSDRQDLIGNNGTPILFHSCPKNFPVRQNRNDDKPLN